ncbi:MAG: GDP-mannose 4,6-dehydratase, partial [Polyangiaceae bacterium]
MKVLITGITGFAGSHLADHLLATQPDAEVAGLYRWRSRTENVEHLVGRVRMVECDIRDATATREAIEAFRPDYIFHLAAQSFVPSSWRAPQETLSTNLLGQLNVFEAVRKSGMECRIQLA